MIKKKVREEYIRRNLLVCKAIGVAVGIKTMINRLELTVTAPQWLVISLKKELPKAEAVALELVIHRDELLVGD